MPLSPLSISWAGGTFVVLRPSFQARHVASVGSCEGAALGALLDLAVPGFNYSKEAKSNWL